CPGVLETADHIFSQCPNAANVWQLIGITVQANDYKYPWILGKELSLPSHVHLDVIMMVLWQIWKARNALIFYGKPSSAHEVVRRVIKDFEAWKFRYRKHLTQILCWRDYLMARL
ncbi:hypothetical protein SETIT_3G281400v2, partial [Setaria italica]